MVPMTKTIEELNNMIYLNAPLQAIIAACDGIDIEDCFDPVFEPPLDFLEECRKRWENARSPFRSVIQRRIGNTWYLIETECNGNEPLTDKVKRLIFSDRSEVPC